MAASHAFWEQHYADAIPLIGGEEGIRQYCENPVGLLGTVRADMYHCTGHRMHAAMAGDACHAVVPFLDALLEGRSFEICLTFKFRSLNLSNLRCSKSNSVQLSSFEV